MHQRESDSIFPPKPSPSGFEHINQSPSPLVPLCSHPSCIWILSFFCITLLKTIASCLFRHQNNLLRVSPFLTWMTATSATSSSLTLNAPLCISHIVTCPVQGTNPLLLPLGTLFCPATIICLLQRKLSMCFAQSGCLMKSKLLKYILCSR